MSPARPDRLRVTVVSPGYPPDRGGVEEHVAQVARRLAAGGDAVRVLAGTPDPALRGREDVLDGVVVRRYRSLPTPGMTTAPGLVVAGLREAGRGDVLHVHSYHALSGLAALAGRRHPVVLTPHYHGTGHSAAARVLHGGYRHLGARLVAAADRVVCVSAAEARLLEQDFPGVAARTTVIPNGAETAAIRAADPWPEQGPTVLAVGRLEPYKGHDRVVEAMPDVPGARLVVVGRGPERDGLRALAARLGLADRVRVLDDVATPELHRWLRTADVLVSMSAHEAFGMAPVEAAAAGCRTVLSDIPAHREVAREHLHGSATLVPRTAGPTLLATAVRSALEETGREGRVRVRVPDWDDVAARTREVYLEVLDAAGVGGAA
ncbi:glycosyltransferase family 4 protein [Lapillicoccus jejuensis]|uniref:Glycosyltransferase involved in cell wall biosynthesis n=1 Tax=Lapillicoccus jejuensis TaxID=402171 RepID=A0A542E2N1_9MICO|nr:glycosyltransferase family 4 protein [Lapillicoccus jejuensis]TQJ09576.1 glycosyltransferase involved in cell wall biosynthesis [Lapillicoccus jejuensis]